MKVTHLFCAYALTAACLVVSHAGRAATPAAAPTAQTSPVAVTDTIKVPAVPAQPGCASFYDAFHMIESLDEHTRNAGLACLNALNDLAARRHPTKPGAPLAATQ